MGIRHDVLDQLSVQQVLAGGAAQVSTNSKKKPAEQDLGIGCAEMGVLFAIDSGDLAGTGTHLTMEIIQATDLALTAGIVQLAQQTVAIADLIDGAQFFVELPSYMMDTEYFGARFTPVGGTITGAINAYYGSRADFAKYKSFPSVYNVENN